MCTVECEILKSASLVIPVLWGVFCDKMEDIYLAKHSFCGVSKEKTSKRNCAIITITRSMPTSPNSSRTIKYQNEKISQINRSEKPKTCDAIIRSPLLNSKLEKSCSEPSVFDSESSKLNNYDTSRQNSNEVSPCDNNSFEAKLTEDPITNTAESLFLSFQKGDSFLVLSKAEHKNWWAVRSIKQNTVGFVPANYLQLSDGDSKIAVPTGSVTTDHPQHPHQLQTPEEALAGLRARVAAVAATATAFAAARAAASASANKTNAHSATNDSCEAEDASSEDAAAEHDTGALFPQEMIPEPELCRGGAGAAELDRRNRRNHGVSAVAAAAAAAAAAAGAQPPPAAPPMPPFNPEGLIMPRKLHNPVLESNDHKNLHRELLFNQKTGKNVLNQKSELQKAFGKHKEQQIRKELEQQRQNAKSDFERMVEERARRMDLLEKERTEETDKCSQGESEFLKVHAKMRARMDSK